MPWTVKRTQAGAFVGSGLFVGFLRAGLQWQLGQAAEDTAQLSLQPRETVRFEAYAAALKEYSDRIRTLLRRRPNW
jgi:hypothetical protein